MLGHLGEGLLFYLYRLDFDVTRPWLHRGRTPKFKGRPSDYLRDNFYYTMSDSFRMAPFLTTLLEVGAHHIMLASDYSYERIEDAVRFLSDLSFAVDDLAEIAERTARSVFGLGRA